SSLSATIWSLASRSVEARRSFCEVTEVSDASVSRSRSSSKRTWRGESASLLRSTAISSSRKEICAVRLLTSSSCREARPPSSLAATALTSSREHENYLDPTYPTGIPKPAGAYPIDHVRRFSESIRWIGAYFRAQSQI